MDAQEKKYDVTTIGNAIVDTLIVTTLAFVESLGFIKDTMNLIDEKKSDKLFEILDAIKKSADSSINEVSGGNAANVAAGVTSFGGDACFIGKVADDAAGGRFITQLQDNGINCRLQPTKKSEGTGRSVILVTEDNSRTMCTYLGCGKMLDVADLHEDLIAQSKIIFLTAFLWDCPQGKAIAAHVVSLAKKHKCQIAFALSDPLCVKRHQKDLLEYIDAHADIVFGNPKEIDALLGAEDGSDTIKKLAARYSGKNKIIVLTRAKDGAVVISNDEPIMVPAPVVENIRDTTGVGSLFVSGFLYGHTHGLSLFDSTKLGNMAAAEGLKTLGARPAIELKTLIAKI